MDSYIVKVQVRRSFGSQTSYVASRAMMAGMKGQARIMTFREAAEMAATVGQDYIDDADEGFQLESVTIEHA